MINRLFKNVKPSLTLELSSLAKKFKKDGKDVINLSAGEPDFNTPTFVIDKIKNSLDKGFTKYLPSAGLWELREAISNYHKLQGMTFEVSQIVVSPGAKYALFSVLYSVLNRGEEVIIISPYWVSYVQMVNLCGGIPRIVRTSFEKKFQPDIKDVEKNFTERTKVIIVNSPSNPTGIILHENFLKNIYDFARRHNIFIVSDDIYDRIVFDNRDCFHIGSLDKGLSSVIVVNGVSKSLSMTGLRIGWSVSPVEVAKNVIKFQSHSVSCATSICQQAVADTLNCSEAKEFYSFVREEFQKRRDVFCSFLGKIERIRFYKPEGAFYIFVDISRITEDSLKFSKDFLEQYFVATVPGEAFGERGFLRMSLSEGEDRLEEAAHRLSKFIEHYG